MLWLTVYPCTLLTFAALARPWLRSSGTTVALDATMLVLVSSAVVTAAVLPTLTANQGQISGAAQLVTLAYPVGDTVLLSVALIGAVVAGWRAGAVWRLRAAPSWCPGLGADARDHRDRGRRGRDADQVLAALDEAGVAISIDDFGTGHSSLARIARFPIREVKIDRSFVRDMHRAKLPIVSTTIELAHALGLRVVAEGSRTSDADAARARLRHRPGLPPLAPALRGRFHRVAEIV